MKNRNCLIHALFIPFVCISCIISPKQDMIANYESKQLEISQLYEYVCEITTEDKYFSIEFESNEKITYFFVAIEHMDTLTGNSYTTNIVADGNYDKGFISNRDLDVDSQNVDNLLSKLGWTRNELKTLKQNLDNANCISIESEEHLKIGSLGKVRDPMTIGYKRAGMGKYSYKIFNQALSGSLKSKYNDGCKYIFYKDNIVLQYSGGVIGPQCF